MGTKRQQVHASIDPSIHQSIHPVLLGSERPRVYLVIFKRRCRAASNPRLCALASHMNVQIASSVSFGLTALCDEVTVGRIEGYGSGRLETKPRWSLWKSDMIPLDMTYCCIYVLLLLGMTLNGSSLLLTPTSTGLDSRDALM